MTMTTDEIKNILSAHSKWLLGEEGGKRANLIEANLTRANLSDANLTGANLYGANLSRANLIYANLIGANLTGATGLTKQPPHTKVVNDGELIGYKKVNDSNENAVILKLKIPADAKRVNAIGSRKCRASEAIVLEAIGRSPEEIGRSPEEVFRSKHEPSFTYKVGATVKPLTPFDESFTEECASGIHFFVTREEAEEY